MILRTFSALTKIGLRKEQELWDKGIYSIQDFHKYNAKHHSETWTQHWQKETDSIKALLKKRDIENLLKILPNKLHYRLLPNIQKDLVFFDAEMIEVHNKKIIFMATCLFKNNIYSFTQGKNLKELKIFLKDKQFLVTFGGTKNDLPLLYQSFKDKPFLIHIDLKNLTNQIKMKGGLKSIEIQLGLTRKYCHQINGADAPLLWQKFQTSKNQKILESLLHYNAEDTIHQPAILTHCWGKILPSPFKNFNDCQLIFETQKNPHQFHNNLIASILE